MRRRGSWSPGGRGDLAPPDFRPKKRIIGSPSYVLDHPTRYSWSSHIVPLIRFLYRDLGGPEFIHINTYVWHPPYEEPQILKRYDRLSFDVWAGGGRGDALPWPIGDRVEELVWHYPGQPYIDWYIWRRRLFSRARGFEPIPWGTDPMTWH